MRVTINTIAVGVAGLLLAYKAFRIFYWDRKPEMITPNGLPVSMSVGKERSFHSKTRDASMYTLATRRGAIKSGSRIFQKSGFTNGVVEAFFITTPYTVAVPCKDTNYIESGGNALTEEDCTIIDANDGELLEFGNANTTICNV